MFAAGDHLLLPDDGDFSAAAHELTLDEWDRNLKGLDEVSSNGLTVAF